MNQAEKNNENSVIFIWNCKFMFIVYEIVFNLS